MQSHPISSASRALSKAIYGNGTLHTPGNELGYIVSISSCSWTDEPRAVAKGTRVGVVSYYTGQTLAGGHPYHEGVMGCPPPPTPVPRPLFCASCRRSRFAVVSQHRYLLSGWGSSGSSGCPRMSHAPSSRPPLLLAGQGSAA